MTLRSIREDKGISRKWLAEYLGISCPYISMIESGKRPPPHVHIIRYWARALDITIEEWLNAHEGRGLHDPRSPQGV